jgi:hypothetical protein
VLDDPIHWRKLAGEYSSLERLPSGMTPQVRGQLFNGLIAELFTAFGVAAKANQSSVGELDVTFSHAGRRFILEAKWEQRKTSTGPIAKLQRRVEQRMLGVTGVFLSMAGYTEPALHEIDKGRRLDIVLLDQAHWEAMLSGFVPPAELLDLVTDEASFAGSAYTPLQALLEQKAPVPELSFERPGVSNKLSFQPAVDHVSLDGDAADFESRQLGVAPDRDGKVLVTTGHGVLSVDLANRGADWVVPISGCNGNAARSGNAILVHRAHGVGSYDNGAVRVVSTGGAAGDKSLLIEDARGAAWCFDPGSADKNHGALAGMIAIGNKVGTEQERKIPYRPGAATSAAWVNGADLVVAGEPDFLLVSESDDSGRRWALLNSHPIAMVAVDAAHTVSLSEDASLWATDVRTGQSVVLGRLDGVEILDGRLIRAAADAVHLAVGYRRPGGKTRVCLMRIRAVAQWLPPELPIRVESDGVQRGSDARPVERAVEPAAGPSKGSKQIEAVSLPGDSGLPTAAPQSTEDSRLADRRRGQVDAGSLLEKLPLHALEGAVRSSFDVARWLNPWRDYWRGIAAGHAPSHVALPEWLPALAQFLGSYVAPKEALESHFTPTPSYVIGFSAGLQEEWLSLVRRGFVPSDVNVLAQWLAQPVRTAGSPARPRGLMTSRELRSQSYKDRGRASWKWAVRISLWLVTLFFAVGTIISIVLTATDGWPQHDFGNALGGNLFYGLPFLGLSFLVIRDFRNLRKRADRRSN